MTTKRYTSTDSAVDGFYAELAEASLQPLWEMHGLLTSEPNPKTLPFRWRAAELFKLAARSGEVISIDRGGDRRVMAMANPGLGGAPYISTTLWAAVQCLMPGETAPPHRHSPAALRFILDGDGVYTAVDGDPVRMSRGDLILTPAWAFHDHHNPGHSTMIWLDVLDLPIVEFLESIFFEVGEQQAWQRNPPPSVAERRYGLGPGLLAAGPRTPAATSAHSPLVVYRWAETDSALHALLEVDRSPEATVRYSDPTRAGDVMPTLRCDASRVVAGASTTPRRQTGSRVAAVLNGNGCAVIGDHEFDIDTGDVFVVPSWATYQLHANKELDIFSTSDAPVIEKLHLYREEEPKAQ